MIFTVWALSTTRIQTISEREKLLLLSLKIFLFTKCEKWIDISHKHLLVYRICHEICNNILTRILLRDDVTLVKYSIMNSLFKMKQLQDGCWNNYSTFCLVLESSCLNTFEPQSTICIFRDCDGPTSSSSSSSWNSVQRRPATFWDCGRPCNACGRKNVVENAVLTFSDRKFPWTSYGTCQRERNTTQSWALHCTQTLDWRDCWRIVLHSRLAILEGAVGDNDTWSRSRI